MSKQLLILLLSGFLSRFTFAQTTDKTVPAFFEKIYLHTDRDGYIQGEDIWFKAYLVNAQTDKPINYSHILYVELINPSAKIISRQMVRLDNGLGNGDFKLADTLAAGTYRLRAYTNWMRNFGDNFVFEKNINVVSLGEEAIKAIAAAPKKSKIINTAATTPESAADTLPVVRFFPEGGQMISGVSTIIAVKAEDINGKGVAATGKITDNSGKIINNFMCDSLGFGAFDLMPDKTQHYQALVTVNGQQRRFILPEIATDGFGLKIINQANNISINLNCNEETLKRHINGRLYLTAKHGGKTFYREAVPVTGKQTIINIPADSMPEGITCIMLKDELTNPVAERLVYVHNPGGAVLNITADKSVYAPKEITAIKLKLNTGQKANLSLAAVDAGAIPVQPENILTYLNLQSEIKGNIEHPGRYFDTTNINRFKQLDLLLLTQGWRNFVWKRLEDTTLKFDREVEQGLTITGKVRKVWTKGSLAGINITMHAPKAEGQKLFWATTDADGHFTIDNPVFYGYQFVSFNSRRSDKLKDDGSAKGYSGGWLQVDSLGHDTLAVSAVRTLRDTINLKRQEALELERLRRSLRLPDSRNLKEVTIKANTSRLSTREAPQVHAITRAEQKEYVSLGQYLAYIIPEAGISQDGTCPACYPGLPPPGRELIIPGIHPRPILIRGVYADHSYIDYCRVCQEDYVSLKMEDVLKVTINRYRDVFGLGISVSIIMRPGVLEAKDYFDDTVADIVGYYKARVFYQPKPGASDDKPDLRTNTIYWEPNIFTDKNGEATVSFYNIAQPGKVRLVVEGVTDKGEPVTASAMYILK